MHALVCGDGQQRPFGRAHPPPTRRCASPPRWWPAPRWRSRRRALVVGVLREACDEGLRASADDGARSTSSHRARQATAATIHGDSWRRRTTSTSQVRRDDERSSPAPPPPLARRLSPPTAARRTALTLPRQHRRVRAQNGKKMFVQKQPRPPHAHFHRVHQMRSNRAPAAAAAAWVYAGRVARPARAMAPAAAAVWQCCRGPPPRRCRYLAVRRRAVRQQATRRATRGRRWRSWRGSSSRSTQRGARAG